MNVGVAHPLLEDYGLHPGLDAPCSEGVSQAVLGETFEACLLADPV